MSAPARTAPQSKLPAYGRDLLDLRERGMVPERGWCLAHVLIVLDSWNVAARRWRLVVSRADDDPAGLDFAGCAGLDCILIHDSRITAPDRLKAAIWAVLRGSPSSLATFDVLEPHKVRIIKSRAIGIELQEFVA